MCQHPEITCIEATGYPSWLQEKEHNSVYCEECGKPFDWEDQMFADEHHKYLCKECLLFFHARDNF